MNTVTTGITIDAAVCRKDGRCAIVCPRAVFHQNAKRPVPQLEAPERCIGCGHCVAVCLAGAITHGGFGPKDVQPVQTERLPSYDGVMELLRSRRSKRHFRKKPVERGHIEKILEAARFAPSSHNEQTTEFVVVQDKSTIDDITSLTADGLTKLAGYTKNPIGRMMMRRAIGRRGAAYVANMAPELEGLVSLYRGGTDYILREAPALVLFCADSVSGTFAGVNANLALHNAALAAETVGLGCFYAGFVVVAAERDDSIARRLSLPEDYKIYGALALGYPLLKFKNWVERKPARVTWM